MSVAAAAREAGSVGLRACAAIADTWGGGARALCGVGAATCPSLARPRAILHRSPPRRLAPDSLAAFGARLGAHHDLLVNRARPHAPLVPSFRLAADLTRRTGQIAEPIEPIRPGGIDRCAWPSLEPIGAAETIARYIGKPVDLACELECKGLAAQGGLISSATRRRQPRTRCASALGLARDAKRTTRPPGIRRTSSILALTS